MQVLKHDRVVGVMVGAHDFEAMRAFHANRLQNTMDQTAANVVAQGLNESDVDTLLADES